MNVVHDVSRLRSSRLLWSLLQFSEYVYARLDLWTQSVHYVADAVILHKNSLYIYIYICIDTHDFLNAVDYLLHRSNAVTDRGYNSRQQQHADQTYFIPALAVVALVMNLLSRSCACVALRVVMTPTELSPVWQEKSFCILLQYFDEQEAKLSLG